MQPAPTPPDDAPLIGVSACLLGERVRYDGSDRLAPRLVDALGRHLRLVPTCPEVLAGMGVPREPVHLVGDPAAPRVLGVTSRRDWTGALTAAARARVTELLALGISGHVLKSRSPSCGLRGIRVAAEGGGHVTRDGVFAAELRRRAPALPLAQEDELDTDAAVREFVARVRDHHRRHCV